MGGSWCTEQLPDGVKFYKDIEKEGELPSSWRVHQEKFLKAVEKDSVCTTALWRRVFLKGRLPDPTGCHQPPSPGVLHGLTLCPVPSARAQWGVSLTPHESSLLGKACLGTCSKFQATWASQADVLEPYLLDKTWSGHEQPVTGGQAPDKHHLTGAISKPQGQEGMTMAGQ